MTTHILLGDPVKAKAEAIRRNAAIVRASQLPAPETTVLVGEEAWRLWDAAVSANEVTLREPTPL